MNFPKFGVFSTETLLLHSLATGEHQARFIKRAAILFEKLVLVPLILGGDTKEVDHIMSIEQYLGGFFPVQSPLRKEYLDLFVLVTDLVSSLKDFYEMLIQPSPHDFWKGEREERFLSFVQNVIRSDFIDVDDPYAIESLPGNFASQIAMDCRLFQIVSQNFDHCSALFSEYHEAAILATLSTKVRSPHKTVTIISDLNTFDFADLSWKDIFILRKSDFVGDFRSRLAEWVLEHSSASDSATFADKVNSFIEEAKFRLIGDTAPALRKTILAGLGGMLPSPFGVNPISLFSTLGGIKREHDLKKKYGWLFLIQRSRQMTKSFKNTVAGLA